MGQVIALLGAESTGKTSLSLALAKALTLRGRQVTVVPEVLRQWCDQHGRTPRRMSSRPSLRRRARRLKRLLPSLRW